MSHAFLQAPLVFFCLSSSHRSIVRSDNWIDKEGGRNLVVVEAVQVATERLEAATLQAPGNVRKLCGEWNFPSIAHVGDFPLIVYSVQPANLAGGGHSGGGSISQ